MNSSVIILAGAGHANIQCLKMMAMKPVAGVDVILVSECDGAPYSGMLPGYMMDHYDEDEIYFNLWKLTSQAGFHFIRDRITEISPKDRLLRFTSGRAPLAYDVLSLNIGITPKLFSGREDQRRVIPLKPIAGLISRWDQFLRELPALPNQRIAVVGGGAAGVETSVAIAKQITDLGRADRLCLFDRGRGLAQKAQDELESLGIEIKFSSQVIDIQGCELVLADGSSLAFDYIFLATDARAPEMFRRAGFATDEEGFLSVSSNLQSLSHSNVFGAGDCIHFSPSPLPKAGVFAVREGRVLGHNLKQYAQFKNGSHLREYQPQRRYLKLVHVSPEKLLASRGSWSQVSSLFWPWKSWIDRKFMRRFGDIPVEMNTQAAIQSGEVNSCGGCGAKLSQAVLGQVLSLLQDQFRDELPLHTEDCYPLPGRSGNNFVSVDGIRSFIQDPFLFGRISTLHALSDLWVSGVIPRALTLSVGLAHRSSSHQINYLLQLMSGILSVCKEFELKLSNAHSFENAEDHVSITAIGERGEKLLRKSGAQAGDLIVISKPLGTGIALQALMKGDLPIQGVRQLIDLLTSSNWIPGPLLEHLHCATDVTGFGLIGHLREVLQASGKSSKINQAAIPLIPGLDELLRRGHRSFLTDENKKVFLGSCSREPHPALLDPQTNGPVLATLPAEKRLLLPPHWHCIGSVEGEKAERVELF